MIKSQLIETIGRKQDHLSEQDINLSINAILEKMIDHLCQKGRIEIRGFGSFSLHYRAPRKAHNPKTGEHLVTAPKHAIHFKPGKEMRIKINNSAKDFPLIQENNTEE